MTYRETFDPLGHPRPLPTLHKPRPDWQHRTIRWGAGLASMALLFIFIWVR